MLGRHPVLASTDPKTSRDLKNKLQRIEVIQEQFLSHGSKELTIAESLTLA